MRSLLFLVALSASALAQRPARIGPDGKPLLNRPVLEECQKSEFLSFTDFLREIEENVCIAQDSIV